MSVIYGSSEEQQSALTLFNAGMNEGVTLNMRYVPSITLGTYTGEVIALDLTREGATMTSYYFPVDPTKVKPREVKDGNFKRMQTPDEAIQSSLAQLNSNLKVIVTGYGVPDEAWDLNIKKKGFNSFREFAEAVIALLPEGYQDKPGKFILIYNKKGFPTVPYSVKNTGRFWLADGVPGTIEVTTAEYAVKAYFTPPVQVPTGPAATPEMDSEW